MEFAVLIGSFVGAWIGMHVDPQCGLDAVDAAIEARRDAQRFVEGRDAKPNDVAIVQYHANAETWWRCGVSLSD